MNQRETDETTRKRPQADEGLSEAVAQARSVCACVRCLGGYPVAPLQPGTGIVAENSFPTTMRPTTCVAATVLAQLLARDSAGATIDARRCGDCGAGGMPASSDAAGRLQARGDAGLERARERIAELESSDCPCSCERCFRHERARADRAEARLEVCDALIAASDADHLREVDALRARVTELESKIRDRERLVADGVVRFAAALERLALAGQFAETVRRLRMRYVAFGLAVDHIGLDALWAALDEWDAGGDT